MEINADNVINELLEQNKSANYQITLMKVATQQLEQRLVHLDQENAQLKAHIKAFENQAKDKAPTSANEAEESH